MLAHTEKITLSNTLKTYIKNGFLQKTTEFLLYFNARQQEMEDLVAGLLQENNIEPTKIKIMGDSQNHGILNAINWLIGNASYEHILFLEKDFQLIEPLECVMEQMATGLNLLESEQAHVIRYRSRWRPGAFSSREISLREAIVSLLLLLSFFFFFFSLSLELLYIDKKK